MKITQSKNFFIFILLNTLLSCSQVFSAPKQLTIPDGAISKHRGRYARAYWYEGSLRKNDLWFSFLDYDKSYFYNVIESRRLDSDLIKAVVIERRLDNRSAVEKDPSLKKIYRYSFIDKYYNCRNRTSDSVYTGGRAVHFPPDRVVDGYPAFQDWDDKEQKYVGEFKPNKNYIKLDNEDHPMWYYFSYGIDSKLKMTPVVRNSNGEAMLEGACRYFK